MSSCCIVPFIIMQCPPLSLTVVLALKSILQDTTIATPAFFSFPFACNIFLYTFTFSRYVSCDLRWDSWRQRVYGSCFFIYSATLCLFFRKRKQQRKIVEHKNALNTYLSITTLNVNGLYTSFKALDMTIERNPHLRSFRQVVFLDFYQRDCCILEFIPISKHITKFF